MYIIIFFSGFILSLIVYGVYQFGIMNGQKAGAEAISKSFESIFDASQEKDPLGIFNKFIERLFLKYFHSQLVSYYNQQTMYTEFVQAMTKVEDISNFVSGFTTHVIVHISPEIKKLFYRFYKEPKILREKKFLTKEGTRREMSVLETYIADWTILRIRMITAQFTTSVGVVNYSEEHARTINARMFSDLEMQVYEIHGIVNLPDNISKARMPTKEEIARVIQ